MDKKKYKEIGFVVFMFVLATVFIKEYIFSSSTLIGSSFSGLIGYNTPQNLDQWLSIKNV